MKLLLFKVGGAYNRDRNKAYNRYVSEAVEWAKEMVNKGEKVITDRIYGKVNLYNAWTAVEERGRPDIYPGATPREIAEAIMMWMSPVYKLVDIYLAYENKAPLNIGETPTAVRPIHEEPLQQSPAMPPIPENPLEAKIKEFFTAAKEAFARKTGITVDYKFTYLLRGKNYYARLKNDPNPEVSKLAEEFKQRWNNLLLETYGKAPPANLTNPAAATKPNDSILAIYGIDLPQAKKHYVNIDPMKRDAPLEKGTLVEYTGANVPNKTGFIGIISSRLRDKEGYRYTISNHKGPIILTVSRQSLKVLMNPTPATMAILEKLNKNK